MLRKGLLWIGLAALTSACLGSDDNKKADDATATFFKEMAAKQYAQIYSESSPDLQQTATSDQFVSMMQQFDQLPPCQAPVKKLDIQTQTVKDGVLRSQGYTQACGATTIQETVTILVSNGTAKLAGFKFNS